MLEQGLKERALCLGDLGGVAALGECPRSEHLVLKVGLAAGAAIGRWALAGTQGEGGGVGGWVVKAVELAG